MATRIEVEEKETGGVKREATGGMSADGRIVERTDATGMGKMNTGGMNTDEMTTGKTATDGGIEAAVSGGG
jgi:hypothetical protein